MNTAARNLPRAGRPPKNTCVKIRRSSIKSPPKPASPPKKPNKMTQGFNRLGQGTNGEIEIPREQEPQQYFKVNSIDIPPSGFGYIPPEAAKALIGERFKISGIDIEEGKSELVRIQAEDIALSLGMDGSDPHHAP